MTLPAVVRRVLGIPVALFVALLLQVVLVNRAGLPGDATPDLVLLVVAATGALTGPVTGMFAGFFGGLALDVIPPGGHLAGEYALVFCLVGYGCGRLREIADPMEEHVTVVSVSVTGGGAVVGEAGKVALGMMLSDPEVTGPAVRQVLPGAILYDLILGPFVLWLVASLIRRTSQRLSAANDPYQTPPRTAAQYGAIRLSTAGAPPKLRLSGSLSAATPVKGLARGRAEPRLRLSGGTSPATFRTPMGTSSRATALPGRRPASVNFSGSSSLLGGGALGPSLFQRGPANWIGRPGGSSPGKGWLNGSASASSARLAARPGPRRTAPDKGWLKSGSLAAPAPRLASPGKGWLKPGKPGAASAKGGTSGGLGSVGLGSRGLGNGGLGKGWLKSGSTASGVGVAAWRKTSRRKGSPGKGWLSASAPRQRSVKRKSPDFKRSSPALRAAPARLKSPGRGWLKGSGAGRSRAVYRSSAMPPRRRRGLRIGGRR
ncbi:MAG TPA: rod shape-determining protein MreD [Trebonia sp.]|jgi:rod shape-determining protein MreD